MKNLSLISIILLQFSRIKGRYVFLTYIIISCYNLFEGKAFDQCNVKKSLARKIKIPTNKVEICDTLYRTNSLHDLHLYALRQIDPCSVSKYDSCSNSHRSPVTIANIYSLLVKRGSRDQYQRREREQRGWSEISEILHEKCTIAQRDFTRNTWKVGDDYWLTCTHNRYEKASPSDAGHFLFGLPKITRPHAHAVCSRTSEMTRLRNSRTKDTLRFIENFHNRW